MGEHELGFGRDGRAAAPATIPAYSVPRQYWTRKESNHRPGGTVVGGGQGAHLPVQCSFRVLARRGTRCLIGFKAEALNGGRVSGGDAADLATSQAPQQNKTPGCGCPHQEGATGSRRMTKKKCRRMKERDRKGQKREAKQWRREARRQRCQSSQEQPESTLALAPSRSDLVHQ